MRGRPDDSARFPSLSAHAGNEPKARIRIIAPSRRDILTMGQFDGKQPGGPLWTNAMSYQDPPEVFTIL